MGEDQTHDSTRDAEKTNHAFYLFGGGREMKLNFFPPTPKCNLDGSKI